MMKRMSKIQKETLSAVCMKTVEEVEKKTSAEIVPVFMEDSDDYRVANYRSALLFAILGAAIGHLFENPEKNDSLSLLLMSFGIIAGFFLGFIPFYKRLFLTKKECQEESKQRAIQFFYEKELSSLPERNALLLFVSEMEQQIHLLADIGLAKKVEQAEWDQVVKKMAGHFKKGQINQGWIEAIETCGDLLKTHYPPQNTRDGDSSTSSTFSNHLHHEK